VTDPLLLALLFVAVATGWGIGRWSGGRDDRKVVAAPPSQYYRGLNYLLDGRQDGAIDAFIRALEVNSETFDTHIALGNLLRRRGEVERAIRVHQNLLARPSLPSVQRHLAHLELARDYISAGLLDRAEKLLLDLVAETGDHRRRAQRYLLEIYEAQRDWPQAITLARELLPRKSLLRSNTTGQEVGQSVAVLLAHYCCEQAEQLFNSGDLSAARELVQEALKHDAKCVRAALVGARLELRAERPAQALKLLQQIREQDSDLLSEAVPLLREAYGALNKRASLRSFLIDSCQRQPSTPLVLAIAEEILEMEGVDATREFLRDSLSGAPSMRGLAMLMRLDIEEAQRDEDTELGILQQLIDGQASYQCRHCGFKGQQMHWYCPGCKHWGTVRDQGFIRELSRG
jgi:lipopolysaccharide biosynthesis regulator YciM